MGMLRRSWMIIFRVQMETSSLQGSTAGCNVQGWVPVVGRILPFTLWDILGALVMLFTKYGDSC